MKEGQQHKLKHLISFSLCLAAVFAASTIYFASQAEQYRQRIEYTNEYAYSALVESVSNLDSALQKISYAGSSSTLSTLSAQIWRESENAKAAMAMLPLGDAQLEKTEKYIAQAGDYAYSILRDTAKGKEITDDQRKALKSLSSAADNLSGELMTVSTGFQGGQLSFGGLSHSSTPQRGGERLRLSDSLSGVEQEFPEYATLIYDGPFSEHIAKRTPSLIQGMETVSQEGAAKNAAWFAGQSAPSLSLAYEGGDQLKCYCFAAEDGSSISVTKQGGIVFELTNSRELGQATLSPEEAVEKAGAFLKEKGYENMKESYYTIFEDMITINFAYHQNDITVYPDLIKVGVALDNGDIVRFDARGYVMSHKSRKLPQPKVPLDEARSKVSGELEVQSAGLALIPTDGQNEVLCYEFVTKTPDGLRAIVYINAETGLEENILILLESENGVLAM